MPTFSQAKLPPRILIYGEPAAGKTGAIAQLANAGYRIMLHDFDRNSRVIGSYLKPDAAPVYRMAYAAAKLTDTNLFDEKILPSKQAYEELRKFCRMLVNWKTETEDLGPTAEMTAKDVIVVDSGTFLGEMLLLAALENQKGKERPDLRAQYQDAGKYSGAVRDMLCGDKIGATVIVLTHNMQTGDKDDQGKIIGRAKEIPVAVGEKMSKRMPAYFSDIWRLEVDRAGNRVFKTAATDKESLRTSAPHKIKASEPFDLASMLNRLIEA